MAKGREVGKSIKPVGSHDRLTVRQAFDKVLPARLTREDFDFDAQVVDRNLWFENPRDADGVLFGGENRIEFPAAAAAYERFDFLGSKPVMVGVGFRDLDLRIQFSECIFEALRNGDPAD